MGQENKEGSRWFVRACTRMHTHTGTRTPMHTLARTQSLSTLRKRSLTSRPPSSFLLACLVSVPSFSHPWDHSHKRRPEEPSEGWADGEREERCQHPTFHNHPLVPVTSTEISSKQSKRPRRGSSSVFWPKPSSAHLSREQQMLAFQRGDNLGKSLAQLLLFLIRRPKRREV